VFRQPGWLDYQIPLSNVKYQCLYCNQFCKHVATVVPDFRSYCYKFLHLPFYSTLTSPTTVNMYLDYKYFMFFSSVWNVEFTTSPSVFLPVALVPRFWGFLSKLKVRSKLGHARQRRHGIRWTRDWCSEWGPGWRCLRKSDICILRTTAGGGAYVAVVKVGRLLVLDVAIPCRIHETIRRG